MNGGRLDPPEPTPPFGLDRDFEIRMAAPFSLKQVVHAFQAALIILTVRVVQQPEGLESFCKLFRPGVAKADRT
jgi:hypothetical protein